MPNRILKQSICTSPNLNHLSMGAERFFYRLLVQCDDYGQFFANPSILRGLCFPMHLNDISEMDVTDWLNELIREKLVNVYCVDEVQYLQFTKWKDHQQIRATKPKYPQPIPVEEPINVNTTETAQVPVIEINGNQVKSSPAGGESAPNTNTTPITGTNTITGTNGSAAKTNTKAALTGEPIQIQRYRAITNVTPPPETWERIINAMGDKSTEDLKPYFDQWLTVSDNRKNLAWLLEWAASGRPATDFGTGARKDSQRAPGRNGQKQSTAEYEAKWAAKRAAAEAKSRAEAGKP